MTSIININTRFKKTLLLTSMVLALSACDSSNDDTPKQSTNAAPVITSASISAADESTAFNYTLTATDADNDTLTMSASTLPSWLSFDAASGVLSGTPSNTDVGDHAVTLMVNDGTDTASQSFTITVSALVVVPTNIAPAITSTSVLTATENSAYSYTLTATDADGDTLAMSASGLPTWLSFNQTTGVLSGTPITADIGDHPITLTVNDGTVDTDQTFTITVSAADIVDSEPALVVFENTTLANWAPWDCCGGSTPTQETDADAAHDQVTQFSVLADTVNGFTARDADGAVGGTSFDASSFANTGTVSFDLKMTSAPNAGVVDWKFKVESVGAASFIEVNLSSSQEGHITPVLDTWQTYTFNLSDLAAGGLDLANIDLFMIFPAWGSGVGAVYSVDNIKIFPEGAISSNAGDGSTTNTTTGVDFEGAQLTWESFDTSAVEFINNPETSGINPSATVAKFNLLSSEGEWIGARTEGIETFALSSANSMVKIMVYKDIAGPVALKFEKQNGDGWGSAGHIEQAYTTPGVWTELTFDFSSQIGHAETDAVGGFAIFPDRVAGRTGNNVVLIDNITFSSAL